MATTTNYSWTTPDDTDLVKDGAAAIRTLGSSIDTTTKNLNPQTTTGAIAFRSATSNVNTSLAIGTAGQVLTVNSGATAPEWATPAAGGMTVIASGSLTGAQVDLTSIPATYKNLKLVIRNFTPSSDGDNLGIRLQNDSNTRYKAFLSSSSSVNNQSFDATRIAINPSQDDTVSQSSFTVDFEDYSNTVTWKMASILAIATNQTTNTNFNAQLGFGVYNQTTAISEINLFNIAGGNFNAGTYILYGVS